MNSFRCSIIRNAKIVGYCGNMVCFEKKNKYGYFNIQKVLGIVIKKTSESYTANNEILCGKYTVYANKGTYFGGMTYAFSYIEQVSKDGIVVRTGKFKSIVSYDQLSVIYMTDKIQE